MILHSSVTLPTPCPPPRYRHVDRGVAILPTESCGYHPGDGGPIGEFRETTRGVRRLSPLLPALSGAIRTSPGRLSRSGPSDHRWPPAPLDHHRQHTLSCRTIGEHVHAGEWSGQCRLHLLHRRDPLDRHPGTMVLRLVLLKVVRKKYHFEYSMVGWAECLSRRSET